MPPEYQPPPTSAPDGEPAHAEPSHAEPGHAEPSYAASALSGPAHGQPVHAAPSRRVPWLWIAGVAGVVFLLAGVAAVFLIVPDARQVADNSATPGAASNPGRIPSADAAPPVPDPSAPTAPATSVGPGIPAAPAAPGVAGATCAYPPDDTGGAGQRLVPTPPTTAAYAGPVVATMRTNLGAITLELDAAKAPCAVNALASLARENYYTDTDCHRLTTDGLWVVQCGDPTGTGTGTPGYRYEDENLPPPDGLWVYARGTIALANAGPDSNGAQFFIVYRDSELGPDYPVVGRVTAGMEMVDKVVAGGTDNGTTDGRPAQPLHVTQLTVG